jgi:hypothetical protein
VTEETALYTVPKTNGDAPLPRRAGSRTMLPPTWVSRTLRVEYVGAAGEARQTSATLLDWCPLGIIVNAHGAKTIIPYERLGVVELVDD